MNLIFLFSALAAVFAIAYVVKRYFFFRLKRVGKYPADFVIFNAKVFTSNSA